MGRHDTCGADLVNHCVNDILVQGARPLFFLDYIATGTVEPGVIEEVIEGVARGCRENGTALLGGETAEMPGFYAAGEYDLAGTIVGVVDRHRILDGSRIVPGDLVLGLPSAGLHTNGYSLARKVFFEDLGKTPGDPLPGARRPLDRRGAARSSPLLSARARADAGGGARCTAWRTSRAEASTTTFRASCPAGLGVEIRVGDVAGSARVPRDRTRGSGLLRRNASRLQHGDRHGRVRRGGGPRPGRPDSGRRRGRAGTRSAASRRGSGGSSSSRAPLRRDREIAATPGATACVARVSEGGLPPSEREPWPLPRRSTTSRPS